jgi:hypothetical protein
VRNASYGVPHYIIFSSKVFLPLLILMGTKWLDDWREGEDGEA